MKSLSKQAFWLLLTVVLATSLSTFVNGSLTILIIAVCSLCLILIKDTDLLNNLLFLSIPLSIEMKDWQMGGIIFPSELIAVVIFGFTLLNIFVNGKLWKKEDWHPASIALLVLWVALFMATCVSTMPIVSIKSLIIFTLYLFTFYFQWFLYPSEEALLKMEKAIRFYFFGLLYVCLFTTMKHASFGFERAWAMRVPPPFFTDHTIYAACMAFLVPMNYYWIKTSKGTMRLFYLGVMGLLFLAIFTTYSRAVWMSLIMVLLVYYLLKIRVPVNKLIGTLLVLLFIVVLAQEPLIAVLSQNRSNSKARKAEVSDQLKSVTNISTDVSNLERINRWKSALAMFADEPLSGHGPGTYQFNFIPYQRTADKTSISVEFASNNFSQGTGGTAHSQYLLYAAESGIFTLIAFVTCILYTVKAAFDTYYRSTDEKEKLYIKALLGGYITFIFHSFFNNFLDVDKAASLFFLFSAAIIILALKNKKQSVPIKIQH